MERKFLFAGLLNEKTKKGTDYYCIMVCVCENQFERRLERIFVSKDVYNQVANMKDLSVGDELENIVFRYDYKTRLYHLSFVY